MGGTQTAVQLVRPGSDHAAALAVTHDKPIPAPGPGRAPPPPPHFIITHSKRQARLQATRRGCEGLRFSCRHARAGEALVRVRARPVNPSDFFSIEVGGTPACSIYLNATTIRCCVTRPGAYVFSTTPGSRMCCGG